tara:strand:- start:546 stop:2447 length:1902 start_codon:yes stop_codon:yes gene_type:complete
VVIWHAHPFIFRAVIPVTGQLTDPLPADASSPAAGPRRFPRIGIKPTVTACIMVIVVAGIGLTAWQQWSIAREATDELTRRNAQLVVDQVEGHLSHYLDPLTDYVDWIADLAAGREDLGVGNADSVRNLLAASVAALPQIVGAGVVPADGPTVGIVRTSDGRTVADANAGAARATMPPGIAEVGDAAAIWSRPAFDAQAAAPVVRLWRAVRRDGKFLGAVYAGVSFAGISEAVSDVSSRFNGTAFLLDGAGGVLAHPNLTSTHPDYAKGTTVIGLERSGDLVLQGLIERSSSGRPSGGGLTTIEAILDGTDYVGFLRPIRPVGENAWALGVWFLSTDMLGQRQRVIASAWIGLSLIAAALAMSWIAGNLIAEPIRETALAVKGLGQMDLDTVSQLPRSSIRELDDLATAFNSMRGALRLFGTYVPRSLVKRMVAAEGEQIESSEREVAIMFTDIVGFTTFSEGKGAAEVAEFLNDHFQILGRCVDNSSGTIDKYIGDALMAFWGAPEDMEDAPVRACYCAMAIADALERDNAKRRQEGLPPVYVRIGLHAGSALVGNIGAEGRVNYTVIGDNVNICQRVESLGREVDVPRNTTTILITDAVAQQLPSSMPFVHIGNFDVKGREEEIVVYRLVI